MELAQSLRQPSVEVGANASGAKSHTGVQLDAIESLRGVAALMVLFYHLAELLKLPLPLALNVVRTHFGLGVPLFYSLSGFVLAFGYAERLESRSQVLAYYVRRFFRIAPLFYVMLGIWLTVNWFAWHAIPSSQTLFLNISFLFGLVPGAHESVVWAGWSIGIEMLFYAFFPITILIIRNIWSGVAAFVVSCILSAAVYNTFKAAGLTSYAYMNLATHLPYFLAGVLCFRIWQRTKFAARPLLGSALLLIAITSASLLIGSDSIYSGLVDLRFGAAERNVWALVFMLVILSVCLGCGSLLKRGLLKRFGQLSFSVYLTHPFVMLVLLETGAVNKLTAHLPGENSVFVVGAIATLAIVFAVSAISFRFIEKPGIALGRYIANRIPVADNGVTRQVR